MSKLSFDIDAVIEGHARLSDAQALELYGHPSLHDLGQWAHAVTQRLHPEDYRTYVIDRNINYTNVCTAKCTFCAFRRDHEDADSYTLTFEKIREKIRELVAIDGTQILMQGGMNDRLPIEWYEDLLRYIKSNFPAVHIHAFSPPEFVEFERFFGHGRSRDHPPDSQAAGLDDDPRRRRGDFRPARQTTHRHRQMHRRRLAPRHACRSRRGNEHQRDDADRPHRVPARPSQLI